MLGFVTFEVLASHSLKEVRAQTQALSIHERDSAAVVARFTLAHAVLGHVVRRGPLDVADPYVGVGRVQGNERIDGPRLVAEEMGRKGSSKVPYDNWTPRAQDNSGSSGRQKKKPEKSLCSCFLPRCRAARERRQCCEPTSDRCRCPSARPCSAWPSWSPHWPGCLLSRMSSPCPPRLCRQSQLRVKKKTGVLL